MKGIYTMPNENREENLISLQHFTDAMADFDAYEAGDTSRLLIRHRSVYPVIKYSGDDVHKLRVQAHLTPGALAYFMGVATSTILSWENDESTPDGPACRMLKLIDDNSDDPERLIR